MEGFLETPHEIQEVKSKGQTLILGKGQSILRVSRKEGTDKRPRYRIKMTIALLSNPAG